jgi:predicted transcriptional regulator
MKTAISIPDDAFQAADRVAKRLALSRSELYSRAVAQFVREHTTDGVTAALDHLYEGEPPTVDPLLSALQLHSLSAEW